MRRSVGRIVALYKETRDVEPRRVPYQWPESHEQALKDLVDEHSSFFLDE